MFVTLTSNGRLTIPKHIRDQLGIRRGTRLDLQPQADGTIHIHVLTHGSQGLFGMLHRPGIEPRTIEEMDAGIAKASSARARRAANLQR